MSPSSLKVAVFSLLVYVLLSLVVLANNRWNAHVFILETPADLPAGQTWGVGYDGRFSYAIASHPWGSTQDLDQPGFRYQRILYPLIVRLLSLGNAGWVPWIMLALNLLAVFIGSAVLGELLVRHGRSAWFALVFFLSLAFLLSVRLDSLEPLTFCLALSGWLAYEKRKILLAIILFALAGLTKEIGLLFPLALIAWEIVRNRWRRAAWLVASLLPYAGWYVLCYFWFGLPQEQVAKSSFEWIPFYGVRYLQDPISRVLVGYFVLLPAVVFGVIALITLLRNPRGESSKTVILVLLEVGLVALMPQPTWVDAIAILRLGLGLLLGVLLWASMAPRRYLTLIAAYWGPSAIVFFMIPNILW
jgi:hypothetical protein